MQKWPETDWFWPRMEHGLNTDDGRKTDGTLINTNRHLSSRQCRLASVGKRITGKKIMGQKDTNHRESRYVFAPGFFCHSVPLTASRSQNPRKVRQVFARTENGRFL